MRIQQTPIFKFEELSEEAQKKAIENYKLIDDFFDEQAIEDIHAAASAIGIKIDEFYYTGFWSQGDGACFDGVYTHKKDAIKIIKQWGDEELLSITKQLVAIQRKHFYKLVATCKHSGHYSHSGMMDVYVEHSEYPEKNVPEQEIKNLLRQFADWAYEYLKESYEWQASDENVKETIISNEYEFTKNGKMI